MATETSSKSQRIYEASFEPRIKTYIHALVILPLVITIFGIVLIPFWLLFGTIYLNKYFDNLHCELTTRSLNFKKGVLFTVERTIPLDKIQDLTFKEGPLLRYFGLSSLMIETAGNSSANMTDMKLIGIVDAPEFRKMVIEQRDDITYNRPGTREVDSGDNEHLLLPLLQEISETLKRIEKKA
jgi:putative membrane protein